MIDLHAHSTFSDGSLTPATLAEAGRTAGLTALALTDHDTVDGLPSFMKACARCPGLTGVPGLEISVDVDKGTMHMLGYFVDPDNANLSDVLQRLRASREIRNTEIMDRLRQLGMPLDPEDVAQFAGDQVAGRPHIAQAMQAKGYVKTFREAFDRYLGKGREAYANRFRLTPEESVAVIVGAGGVPVLAHPFTLYLRGAKLEKAVAALKEAGLEGIEIYYPEHNKCRRTRYEKLARAFDLVATGGTDFHGAITPGIKLGRGRGKLKVPDSVLEALQARRH